MYAADTQTFTILVNASRAAVYQPKVRVQILLETTNFSLSFAVSD